MARGGRGGNSGNGGNDTNAKYGTNGNDILDGFGGSYFLAGGKGDDTYLIDDTGDVIDEKNNGGDDLVISSISYTLGNHLERLTLADGAVSGTGNALNNIITGNDGANTLSGLDGDDTLYGLGGDDVLSGGAGADFLDGGSGNDTAVFSGNSTDYTFEWSNGDLLITYGAEPTDILRDIEFLSFDDGIIAVADIGDDPGDLPLPQAVDDAGSGVEDNALVIAVLTNDQGQGLSVASATNGAMGLVTIEADGTVTYRPDANAFGTDQFTYTISDSLGRTSTATVTVEVLSDNDVPVVIGETYAMTAGSVLDSPNSVLDNDSDVDGDILTVAGYDAATAAGGAVLMNADGTFTYTPAAGYTGSDSFSYTVSDGNGGEASAIVTINVDPAAPQAMPDSITVAEDGSVIISVLSNDSGDGLSVTSATDGGIGSTTVNGDGTITYVPVANANGADSFSYTITDSLGRTSTASVTVDVTAVNDAPVANADSYAALAGEVYTSTGSVLDNDSDPDGDPLTVTTYDSTTTGGGTVQMNPDGTFTYTPAEGFTGTDSFGYAIGDGFGGQSSAVVSLSVTGSEAPPYYVEGLLLDYEWQRLNYPDPYGTADVVTYTFLDAVPGYYSETSWTHNNFTAFSEQQKQITRDVLDLIESFTNLTFVETGIDQAEMTFGLADIPGGSSGVAYTPSSNGVNKPASDVWLDVYYAAGSNFTPGTETYQTLLHELAHALGLGHPSLPADEVNIAYTVMTFASHPTMDGGVEGYQIYDIATLQYLYGANATHATGADVYSFNAFDGVIKTIWDAGGHDVLDMSAASYGVNLDLAEGAFSTVADSGSNNLAIAFGTVIEDAIGSDFDDQIAGNDAANGITGGGGNDQLTGRGGADTYFFGTAWGDDTVTDFVRGEDLLDFSGAGLQFADLDITSSGGGTLITFGANSVMLQGVDTIGESDMVLV